MVNITPVKEQSPEDYEDFFKEKQDQEKLFSEPWVKEHGYFLELDSNIIGFFVLYPISERKAWLRRLVLREQTNPAILFLVFDWITEKAKSQNYEDLYVHVQDSNTTSLLEMNHYEKADDTPVEEPKNVTWYMKKL